MAKMPSGNPLFKTGNTKSTRLTTTTVASIRAQKRLSVWLPSMAVIPKEGSKPDDFLSFCYSSSAYKVVYFDHN